MSYISKQVTRKLTYTVSVYCPIGMISVTININHSQKTQMITQLFAGKVALSTEKPS